MTEKGRTRPFGSGSDPLAAMYFLAAILMGVASLVVVAFIFVPRDLFSGRGGEDVIVPGAGESWVPEQPREPMDSATAARRAAEAEEMHFHDH